MDGIQSVIPLNHEAATDDKSLLSDVIRQALAEEIATGLLNPGTPLDEQQIATRFGASRTPVREALRQLAVTGMVDIRPRRGVTVAMMTAERIMDMFETTAEVEAMCVRLATYRISPVERSQLQEMRDTSAEWVRGGDINAYDDFNRQFHEAIIARRTTSSWWNRPSASAPVWQRSGAPSSARAIASSSRMTSTARSCKPWRVATAMRRPVACGLTCSTPVAR